MPMSLSYHVDTLDTRICIDQLKGLKWFGAWDVWPQRPGDQHAPPGSDKKLRYAQGMDDFSTGGQLRRDEVLKKRGHRSSTWEAYGSAEEILLTS